MEDEEQSEQSHHEFTPPIVPPFLQCSAAHETINLQISNLWRESRRHFHIIFGNEANPGLLTKLSNMENTLKTLSEDIAARKQNTTTLYYTLAATVIGNIITAVLVFWK